MHELGNSCLAVVVDDEWVIRMQIGDALMDAGWEVREFASGELALDYLASGRQIHLLVSDIRLAGSVTGWEVAQKYRKQCPEVRVIYCSGNQPDKLQRVDGSFFLSKPCNMDELRAAIERSI